MWNPFRDILITKGCNRLRQCGKRIGFLLLVVFLCLAFVGSPSYAGSLIKKGEEGQPGTWYIGDTPPGGGTDLPVLLFVHGLNSSAKTWYEDNDMYQIAYNNGYQTAFIDLYGTKNMWDNGSLLAEKIEEIYQYFGRKLVLVTHSKGGIDTQSALVHYNAHPYVSNVITLGSPHKGSQLADLAYSSWASWLSDILGQKSDATYSLQTGYMSYFRSVTDEHANVNKNKYYTFAGKDWGSFGSSLYWGGLYLSSYGSNDGAVVVSHAYLPNGTMVRVDSSWNHSSIKSGSETFQWFQPYLTLNQTSSAQSFVSASLMGGAETESDMVVRGGEYVLGAATETFSVEKDVDRLSIDWMSAEPVDQIEVIDAQNKKQIVQVKSFRDNQFFKGAWHNVIQLNNPKPGKWTIHSTSAKENAFLLTVNYETKKQEKVKLKKSNHKDKWKVEVPSKNVKKNKLKMKVNVEALSETKPAQKIARKELKATDEIHLPEIQGEGIYNVTIDLEGEDVSGQPYERTIIKSIYVDKNGNHY